MEDIIAIEYDVTPTIANMLAMAEQLATVTAERDERSLVAEQLSMALHIRDTQLATVTADRDERSLVAEQLSMALHIRDTQLATVTARAEAAEAKVQAMKRYGYDWHEDIGEWLDWRGKTPAGNVCKPELYLSEE